MLFSPCIFAANCGTACYPIPVRLRIQQVFLGPSLASVASLLWYWELSGFLRQIPEQVVLPECWDVAGGPRVPSSLQGGPHLPSRRRPGTPFWAALVVVRAECVDLHPSAVGEQAGSHSFLRVRWALGWKEPLLRDVTWEKMVLELLAGFWAVEIKNMGLILHTLLFQWCKSMYNCRNAGGKAELSFLRPFAIDNITLKKQSYKSTELFLLSYVWACVPAWCLLGFVRWRIQRRFARSRGIDNCILVNHHRRIVIATRWCFAASAGVNNSLPDCVKACS